MDEVMMLFDTSGFPARWHCGRWSDLLGWLTIGSDAAIALAYTAIPITLATLVLKRHDLPFHWLFWMFSAFIISCGITHLNEVIIFWQPIYRLQGVAKAGTAAISWATVFALVPATRKALTLRTPEQLEQEVRTRTEELVQAQEALQRAHDELEDRVAERTAELERSNRDLAQFAYSASHDLQEPLRMVVSFTELLQTEYGGQLSDEADEYLEFAAGGARRMQQLLQDLLAFSRAGAPLEEAPRADLGEALDSARASLAMAMQQSEAEVEVHGPLPVLSIAPTLLTQVLQNLLGNAIKFARPGTRPRIRVDTQATESGYRVSVRDNGIGFDPAQAERIFEIFRRLKLHDEYEGSGIGLAICHRIVERFGGHIWAESSPGEGATFHFELPAAGPADSEVV